MNEKSIEVKYVKITVQISSGRYMPYKETGKSEVEFSYLDGAPAFSVGAAVDALIPLAIVDMNATIAKYKKEDEDETE